MNENEKMLCRINSLELELTIIKKSLRRAIHEWLMLNGWIIEKKKSPDDPYLYYFTYEKGENILVCHEDAMGKELEIQHLERSKEAKRRKGVNSSNSELFELIEPEIKEQLVLSQIEGFNVGIKFVVEGIKKIHGSSGLDKTMTVPEMLLVIETLSDMWKEEMAKHLKNADH